MRARLCAAILAFEAILLGLSTPVMISVEDVDPALALALGLGLMVICIVAAGMLRRPGGMVLGHLIQVASIALGLLVPVMYFVGGLFALLWGTAFVLGGRIDADRAAWTDPEEPGTPEQV